MILCFSGTGNSQHVADGLAKRLEDEVVSLNLILKNDMPRNFKSEKPFIIVTPIYAWRIPRIIEELLPACTFEGSQKIYFVPTMESETGKADEYCADICNEIGMEFMGLCGIPMPNNYVYASVMPDEETINKYLKAAEEKMNLIAQAISNNIYIKKMDKTAFSGIKSGPVNNMFTKYATSDKEYNVNSDCMSCGFCEIVCPVNNIKLVEGKPTFNGNCIACYSCIHRCPKAAINIGNKTQNHGRYICPEK